MLEMPYGIFDTFSLIYFLWLMQTLKKDALDNTYPFDKIKNRCS